MTTTMRTCPTCRARIIWVQPPGSKPVALDYYPSDTGTWAAQQAQPGTWLGRRLAMGEQPIVPEKRYACHWETRPTCRPLTDRQRAQRAQAAADVRTVLRTMRRKARQTADPTLF